MAEWRGVTAVVGHTYDQWRCTLGGHEFGTERPAYNSDQPEEAP